MARGATVCLSHGEASPALKTTSSNDEPLGLGGFVALPFWARLVLDKSTPWDGLVHSLEWFGIGAGGGRFLCQNPGDMFGSGPAASQGFRNLRTAGPSCHKNPKDLVDELDSLRMRSTRCETHEGPPGDFLIACSHCGT